MSKPRSTLPNPVESDGNLASALAQIPFGCVCLGRGWRPSRSGAPWASWVPAADVAPRRKIFEQVRGQIAR